MSRYRRTYRSPSDSFPFLFMFGGLAIVIGFWVMVSHFEAKAYNNVTGKQISTWDAMFLDLRINEDVQ